MRITVFLFAIFCSSLLRGQCTQTNTSCAAATALTVDASCISESTCDGLPLSGGTTTCTLAGVPNRGVWYTFVATATDMNIVVNTEDAACFNRVIVFEGSCGALTEVGCSQSNPLNSTDSFFLDFTTLVIGNTYTIFVGHRLNGCGDLYYDFCISVNTSTGVVNDDPCDAVSLGINVPCTFENFLNFGATASTGITDPGCANYVGGDVWFSATAPASGELEFDFDAGTISDGGAAAYSGTCSALSLISCDDNSSTDDDMPLLSLNGLTPGETIWIRVWENGGDVSGSFDICATDPSVTPSNDDPCDAQSISVNTTCQFETFTNDGATSSVGPPAPGCANYQGSDVWFSLTVPGSGNVEVDVSEIGMDDPDAAAYSGTCGSLILIDCDDGPAPDFNPTLTLIGLTPGETIWIRVWSYGNVQNGTFEICATELAACDPTNPTCADAISLTVGASCINGSTCGGGAVQSFSCDPSNQHNEAVWYSFVATQTEMLVTGSTSSSSCSFAISTFSGSCGSLTEVGCNYDNSINAALPLSNLTVGSTYFVQVSYTANVGSCDAFIDFCLSVEESPCLGNGSNNTCADADPFCTGSVYTYCNNTGIPSSGPMGCLSSTPNPMWLYFQIDNPGQIDMDIIQSDYYGSNIDVNFSIWGPYSDISAACADAVSNPFTQDCSESTTLTENATIVAGQTGDIYLLLLTNESDVPGQVTITQVGGSGTTDCSIVLPCFISGEVTNASCFGSSDGEIAASWTGSANYTVELFDNASNLIESLTDYTLTTYTFENLSAGSYTLTVTSSDGCTFSESVIVNQPSANTSTTSLTICDTELPYSWNGLTFTAAGSQEATLTSAVTGCDSLATLDLTVNPTPDLFYVLSDSEICSGDITDITLNSSYSATIYSWDFSQTLISGPTTGNGNQISQQINTTSSNQGSVTYIITPILNFCIGTPVEVQISVNPIPGVTVDPESQTIYAGQSATINAMGSPQGGGYFWNPGGETTESITVSPPQTTTYNVTYVLDGCTTDTSAIVIVEDAPEVTSNSGIICSGDSILLIANPTISGGTYLWSNNETSSSIWVSPTTNSVYSVEYTVNGYTTTPSISTVTVNQTPIISVEDQVICEGQSVTISATTSIGGGTYNWLPGGEVSQQINVSPNATTVYQVEYSVNGCTAQDSALVAVNPVPTLTISDTTICSGESVELNAITNLLGGTYLWGDNSTTPIINVSPNSTTSYSVLYTLNGCQVSGTTTVNVNMIPIAQVTNDVICSGETGQLSASSNLTGGSYFWNGIQGANIYTANPSQTTDYTLVYVLNSCESIPVTGTITVNEIPEVILEDAIICSGDNLILTSEVTIPGGVYSWSPTGEVTSAIQVSPVDATTYTLDYTVGGCGASATAQVTVQLPPQLSIEVSDTLGCAPFTVMFENPFATEDTDCVWEFGNGLAVGGCNPTFTFNEEGCYDVTLLSSDGVCTSELAQTNIICVEGPPVASFYANPPIITDPTQWIQFSNNSIGAVDYEWEFGDGQGSDLEQPQHLYTDINDGFVITLIASSELGCVDSAQVSIIYQEEPIVYIPNTFTPDGDQYNHVFVPVFTSGYDPFNYEMLIFNRWGEVVFESHDVNVGWDGTFGVNGTDAQDGAYTYKIIYKVLKTDERRLIVGHVNLIR